MLSRRAIGFLAAAVTGCVAGCACPALAEIEEHVLRGEWIQVRTENFTVVSDLDPARASEVGRNLEKLVEVLAATNPALRAPSPVPTTVYAFRSEASLRPYNLRLAESAAGYFSAGAGRNRLVVNADPALGTETLFHEYVHSLVRDDLATVPVWLNEGLASYYETLSARGDQAEIGRGQPGQILELSHENPFSMSELIGVRPWSRDYGWGGRRGVFYAQSWALVHLFLNAGDSRRKQYETYASQLRKGREEGRAFEAAVPRAEWDALMKESLLRVREGVEYVRYRFGERLRQAQPAVQPLPRAELLFLLGELLMNLEENAASSAEEHFLAALTSDPRHAPSIAALGYLADSRNETFRAESLYNAAAAAAPTEPRVYALAGRGVWGRIESTGTLKSSGLGAVRARYGRCLALDPGNLEALALFGKAWSHESPPAPEGVRALRAAATLLPARLDLAVDLTRALARSGRCAEAESVYRERIAPSGRRRETEGAAFELGMCLISEVEALDRRGHLHEADAAIRRTEGVLQDPKLIQRLHNQVAVVRGGGAETIGRPDESEKAAMELFNRGLRSANQGRYEEALSLLAQARDSSASDGLYELVDEMSGKIRNRMRIRIGISHLNAGELGKAREVFLEMQATVEDDSTRRYVGRLLDRTDARIAIDQGIRIGRGGALKQAGGTFDSVATHAGDADIRAFARSLESQMNTRLAVEKGIERIKAGRLAEARAIFVALLDEPLSETMRGHVRSLIVHVDARIEVEKALALVRKGDLAGARAVLVAAGKMPIGADLKNYIEGLIEQLDQAQPAKR